MLEIILIIGCCKSIGNKARKRGRTAVGYQVMFVLFWIGGEFLGAFLTALGGAEEKGAVYVGALIGAASGAALAFLIVSMLSDVSRTIDFNSQRFGYAPNLQPSDEVIDPANPYASPRTNRPVAPPPTRSNPN
jgi:hypothetical protein